MTASTAPDGVVTTVTIEGGRIFVRTPAVMWPRCEEIPGKIHKKEIGAWTYPPSPSSAQALLDAFRGTRVQADLGFRDLVRQAKAAKGALAAKTATDLPPIPRTRTKPWLHQLRAYHFAYPLHGAMLGMDMGTGKSKVAVDLVVNRDHRRVLVLAPLAVIQEWPGQFQTHAARPVMVYRPYDRRSVREMENTYASKGSDPIVVCPLDDKAGSVRDKVAGAKMAFHYADLSAGSTVIVMNYDAVWREPMADFVMNAGWDCVIGDELHRIQSANGKASKFMGRLGDKVPWRIGLTGTPFSSGPLSIYGQYRFLDKGVFGTSNTEFKRKYCRMGGYQGHQVIGYENQEELQRKFYSIAFRVESRDVLDLPEELHIEKTFDLAPETMKAYRELEEFFIAKIRQGEITVNNALTKLLRLQQMTSGFARLDATDEEEGRVVRIGTEKQELLGELISELDKKEPICVFCRFTHDLQAVAEVCKQQGRTCGFLDGSRKDTEAWKAGQMDVLAIQIRAGGTGVNLTRSCYCFDYSLGFSLADYSQHLARLMRPGQKNMVRFFRLVANKTVDVRVFNAINEKKDVVAAILGDMR